VSQANFRIAAGDVSRFSVGQIGPNRSVFRDPVKGLPDERI